MFAGTLARLHFTCNHFPSFSFPRRSATHVPSHRRAGRCRRHRSLPHPRPRRARRPGRFQRRHQRGLRRWRKLRFRLLPRLRRAVQPHRLRHRPHRLADRPALRRRQPRHPAHHRVGHHPGRRLLPHPGRGGQQQHRRAAHPGFRGQLQLLGHQRHRGAFRRDKHRRRPRRLGFGHPLRDRSGPVHHQRDLHRAHHRRSGHRQQLGRLRHRHPHPAELRPGGHHPGSGAAGGPRGPGDPGHPR